MPSAVDVFEELRFVWELYAAVALFLMALSPSRNALPRLALGLAGFSVLSMGYFPWLGFVTKTSPEALILVGLWYVALTFLMTLYLRWCFSTSLSDALYAGIVGYAAQHVVYVLVHELLALWLWPALTSVLPLYVLVSLVVCAVWYGILYLTFFRKLGLAEGSLLANDTFDVLVTATLLCVQLSLAFGFQHLFHSYGENRAHAVWMSALVCLMVLGLQYANFQAVMANRERATTEQMLREAARRGDLSRDLIENVNRTIHDLKHTMRALEQMPSAGRDDFLNQTTEYIERYETLVYSENEVLNTLLSEKALLCESRGIHFSCALAQVDLGFLSMPDLYVLLGNLVDNAIEGVSALSDPARRAISLQFQSRAGLVLISCDNPFEGDLTMRGGLPVTTKGDEVSHGLGLKSVRLIVERYAGSLTVGAKDQVFTVQIALPDPAGASRPANLA